jgi:hypothetical protein
MKPDSHLRLLKPPPDKAGASVPRRYWLSKEQYAALDEATRAHYILDGADYRLKPNANEIRQQKFALIVLASLAVIFTGLGIYGSATDRWTLQILAFCGGMPTLFGFLVQLAMYFSA